MHQHPPPNVVGKSCKMSQRIGDMATFDASEWLNPPPMQESKNYYIRTYVRTYAQCHRRRRVQRVQHTHTHTQTHTHTLRGRLVRRRRSEGPPGTRQNVLDLILGIGPIANTQDFVARTVFRRRSMSFGVEQGAVLPSKARRAMLRTTRYQQELHEHRCS